MYTESYFEDIKKIIELNTKIRELKNHSLLITGANGLICSALIDFLIYLNEFENASILIYAAGRNEEKMKKRFGEYFSREYFHFVQYDANKNFIFDKNVNYIIHGASNAHPSAYDREPVETMMSNFYGTYNLLTYIKKMPATRFLLISSSEVYGENTERALLKEDNFGYSDILNYRSCYPSSKRAAETLCASFKKEYNIDFTIVRPGHIYGPMATNEDTRASAQFINKALNKESIIMKSAGMQLRSYCHAFDCASSIFYTLLFGKSGEAYNISNKNSIVTIREFAEMLSLCSKQKIIFQDPSLAEKKSYNMMSFSALASDKIENLGWVGGYDLKAGIQQTLNTMNRGILRE